MDISETYIKQCERAEKIQEEHGEVWITFGEGILYSYGNVYYKCLTEEANRRWHLIWLPTQDRLQEMVWTHIDGTYNMLPTRLFAFSDYWEEHGIPTEFTSMEQLWLAFVMKEKYKKIWDGDDWVKQPVEVLNAR